MAVESVVLLTLLLATGVFCQQDRTIVAGESGADVVQAVLAKLQYSGVFTSNSDMRETIFMQRMAYVETRDGTEPPRFPTSTGNTTGGIWNVSPRIFQSTLTQTSLIQSIARSRLLNYVNWTAESQMNLSLPLYSGIAIRIYLSTLSSVPSPGAASISAQQSFWIQHFHPENTSLITSMNTWVNDLNALGENEGCTFTTDTVFVLDTSGSITAPNFQEVRTFTRDFADTLLINETDTSNNRIGIILFQSFATVTFPLNSAVTMKRNLLQMIENLPYSGGGTNTADGLNNMRMQAWRDDIATVRLAVVLTDGKSNDFSATIQAAREVHAHEPGILVFAIGVGAGPNMEELREIASGSEFVATLASFDQTLFSATVASFSYRICNTVSQNISVNTSQSGELQENSTVRLSYTQPATDEGLTLQLCAHTGSLILYASTTVPNPSEALYDFVITIKAVPQYLACNATFFNFTLIAPDQDGRGTITLFITLKGGSKLNNFTLNSDEGFLPDDDECLGEHPCHTDGECVNIYGGFFCRCDSGYFGDGVENCTDVNECEDIEEPCTGNSVCVNRIGDYVCTGTLDPTILIIIIICASGGLALMCITPIIIFVTCFYYRRRKGDMKHSTSYDNLIPEEEPDIDENMYKHLNAEEEEERKGRKSRGIDIERRISQLEKEGLVDELSPTKKDHIAMSYIDELDEGDDKKKENQSNSLQKFNAKKSGPIKSRDEPEKPIIEEEKQDLSHIDDVEPDDNEKEKESKQKSSNEAESDPDKKSWLKKWTAKKPDPNKSKKKTEKPTEKEEKKDISYIDEVEPDDKPKNEPKDKWKLAKQSSEDKTDITCIDDVDPETDDDKANLLQERNAKKPRSVVRDEKREELKHKKVETDIKRRIRELQDKTAK